MIKTDPSCLPLRACQWFDDPSHAGMMVLHLERYLNFGLSAEALEAIRGHACPPSQTHWQELQRVYVGQMEQGTVLQSAVKYQGLAQTSGVPRHSH